MFEPSSSSAERGISFESIFRFRLNLGIISVWILNPSVLTWRAELLKTAFVVASFLVPNPVIAKEPPSEEHIIPMAHEVVFQAHVLAEVCAASIVGSSLAITGFGTRKLATTKAVFSSSARQVCTEGFKMDN